MNMDIKLNNAQLEKISRILGDELTGSSITQKFNELHITDTSGESTKWKRIYGSFLYRTNMDKSPNAFLNFIKEVLKPENYVDYEEKFEDIRSSLNKTLAFSGLEYTDRGQFKIIQKATTISEAKKRTSSILTKLRDKGVNPNVLKYCNEELLNENYFHAILEATKSIADKVRCMSGLSIRDGSELFDKVFSVNNPILAINTLTTDAEQNQQKGLVMLMKGVFSMMRNVTAHTPKIKWIVDENEAIKMLMVISYIQDYLDNCVVVPKVGG